MFARCITESAQKHGEKRPWHYAATARLARAASGRGEADPNVDSIMEMCNGVGQRNHMALRSGYAGTGTAIRCDVDISIKRKAALVINFEKVEKVVVQGKSNPENNKDGTPKACYEILGILADAT